MKESFPSFSPNIALFANLVALILNWNCVKNLIVTKIVLKLSLKGTGMSYK